MWKKLLALLLALACCFSMFAGCQKSDDDGDDDDRSSKKSAEEKFLDKLGDYMDDFVEAVEDGDEDEIEKLLEKLLDLEAEYEEILAELEEEDPEKAEEFEKDFEKLSEKFEEELEELGYYDDYDNNSGNGGNMYIPTDTENYITPDLGGATIRQYMAQNTDYYPNDCWLNDQIDQTLNCNLKVVELDSWTSQYLTMIAEGNVPDLTWMNSYMETYVQLGRDGAYINFYDYLDLIPNIKAFIEDPQNAADIARYTIEPGVLYALPVHQQGTTAPSAFLYRKDVFDKHGIEFPTNQEEFVAVLRQLKQLYPDSNPFIMRSMTGNNQGAQSFGHLWGAAHVLQGNYGTIFTLDENGNYYMAQQSQAYKEMAMFFNELMNEGLMHKASMTVDTAGWMEAFASDRSFITYDQTDSLPVLNRIGQSLKLDFQVVAGAPFNFGTYATTTDVVSTSWATGIGSGSGYLYCVGDNENLDNTLLYIDWLYSQEGQIMTNWGVEGVSWEYDAYGNRKYIDGFLDRQGGRIKTGLGATAMTGVVQYHAHIASLTDSELESLYLALEYLGKNPAQHKIKFTEDEQFEYDVYGTACYNYALQQWSNFVLGQRPFSEWDQVVEELKAKYQYDRLMEIHKAALARLLDEHPEVWY